MVNPNVVCECGHKACFHEDRIQRDRGLLGNAMHSAFGGLAAKPVRVVCSVKGCGCLQYTEAE